MKYTILATILLILSCIVMSFDVQKSSISNKVDLPEEIGEAKSGDTLVIYVANKHQMFIRFYNKADEVKNTDFLFIVK